MVTRLRWAFHAFHLGWIAELQIALNQGLLPPLKFHAFLAKAAEALDRGYHLLLVDLQPPTPRDPEGIHAAISGEFGGKPKRAPADKPLTMVAYDAGPPKEAYVQWMAFGDRLIDMPLFLRWAGTSTFHSKRRTRPHGGLPRRVSALLRPPPPIVDVWMAHFSGSKAAGREDAGSHGVRLHETGGRAIILPIRVDGPGAGRQSQSPGAPGAAERPGEPSHGRRRYRAQPPLRPAGPPERPDRPGALFAAFAAWTRDKGHALADHLVDLGHLDAVRRAAVEAIAGLHVQALGGDPGKSLAVLAVGRSTRESLARAGGPDVEATLGHVDSAPGSTQDDDDADRTATYSVGTATSDGQRFRILRPHAKGGLGAVFVALDGELHREVALKQILEKHADDPISRQRFVAEAEITGGLEHPGVVPVYGLGTDAGGRPYYAMRFIKGDSLKEAIDASIDGRTHNHLPPSSRRPIGGGQGSGTARAGHGSSGQQSRPGIPQAPAPFLDVCNAIDYAHSRGVIHRDLKPANIIVGKHGETLVVDWGLAKAVGRADPSVGEQTLAPSSSGSSETLPGSALGTPAYMSPEQAARRPRPAGPAVRCLQPGRHALLPADRQAAV